MSAPGPVRFAVAGADHLHLFQLVDRLILSGAQPIAHTDEGGLVDAYESWQQGSRRSTLDEILADDSIDLLVTAGIPRLRADTALAALAAGRSVLSDKPGVTTVEQLGQIRNAIDGRPGRPWTVLFSERFENRAVSRAVSLARTGGIGAVVQVSSTGPHSLASDRRPDWFWDPDATGGILVDIGSHQFDQFLAIVGESDLGPDLGSVEVGWAAVGNVACPDHPTMQDTGAVVLTAPGVVGDLRVDYLSPTGLPVWGDVRLTIVGTTGTLEARANIDVTGRPGAEHLIHVDAEGVRRLDVGDDPITWADTLLLDLADDGERLMPQAHVLAVCDLALRAQRAALPWGSGPAHPGERHRST